MPYSHISDYPADILARAAKIRLACFDVDGTLTDGRLLFDDAGRELKAFHIHDGQGLALLLKLAQLAARILDAVVHLQALRVPNQPAAEDEETLEAASVVHGRLRALEHAVCRSNLLVDAGSVFIR